MPNAQGHIVVRRKAKNGNDGNIGPAGVSITISQESVVWKRDSAEHAIIGIKLTEGDKEIPYGSGGADGFLCSTLDVPQDMKWTFRVNEFGYTFAYLLIKGLGVKANVDIPFTITYRDVIYKKMLSVRTNEDGDSAFIVDADDEFIPVSVDKDGKSFGSQHDVTINAFYGVDPVPLGKLTFVVSSSNTNRVATSRNGNVITIDAVQKSVWGKGKEFVTIDVTHEQYGSRRVMIILNPVFPGNDSHTFSLASNLSSMSFARDENGELFGYEVAEFFVKETIGEEVIVHDDIPDGLYIYACLDDSSYQGLDRLWPRKQVNSDDAERYRFLYVELWEGFRNKQGSRKLDRETIPLVTQGKKGPKGDDGTSVKILGSLNSKSDLPSTGKAGDAYLINGELYVWDGAAWRNVGKIQGPVGDSAYVHIAYANSADGTKDFSTTDSAGREYIGTYADNIVKDSEDPKSYNWIKVKGDPGPRGPQGNQGCVIRTTEWAEGMQYLNESKSDKEGIRYIDQVIITEKTGFRAYLCLKSHTSTAENKPSMYSDTAEWQKLNSMQPIYTPMLFAQNAVMTFGQANHFYVMDDENLVVLQLGGGKYPFMMGSVEQGERYCNFKVDRDGVLWAVGGHFEGEVTATSGKIGGFVIDNGNISSDGNASFTVGSTDFNARLGVVTDNITVRMNGGINGITLTNYNFSYKENNRYTLRNTTDKRYDWQNIAIANVVDMDFFSSTSATTDMGNNYGFQYAMLGSGHVVMNGIVEGACFDKIDVFTAAYQVKLLQLPTFGNRIILKSKFDNDIVVLPDKYSVFSALGCGGIVRQRASQSFTFRMDFINTGNKRVYLAGYNTAKVGGQQSLMHEGFPKLVYQRREYSSNLYDIYLEPFQAISVMLVYDESENTYYAFFL